VSARNRSPRPQRTSDTKTSASNARSPGNFQRHRSDGVAALNSAGYSQAKIGWRLGSFLSADARIHAKLPVPYLHVRPTTKAESSA